MGNSPTNATDPSGLVRKLNKEDFEQVEKRLKESGVTQEQIELRLAILRNIMLGKVRFGDYRASKYWGERHSDGLYVFRDNPIQSVENLWVERTDSRHIQRIQCYKYSKIIILKAYIDIEKMKPPGQRKLGQINEALRGLAFPTDLPNEGKGTIYENEERRTGPGFQLDELTPLDQIWISNPHYNLRPDWIDFDKSDAPGALQRYVGEQGSNMYYLFDDLFVDIYTGNVSTLDEARKYVHGFNICADLSIPYNADDFQIRERNAPMPNPFK